MKKIYFAMLVVVTICMFVFISCRKNTDAVTDVVIFSSEGLSKDESFININEAMNRFDPTYLQLVYKDRRTVNQIIEKSNELMKQIGSERDNLLYQQQLAAFYHFSSVDELKKYSLTISDNLKALDKKYAVKKTLFVEGGGNQYYQARKLYAKNKLAAYPAMNDQSKRIGTHIYGLDFYTEEIDYLITISEESEENNYDGSGTGCSESCCLERETCKNNAKSKYFSNLWSYGTGGTLSMGGLGAATGSAVPFWGTVTGAIFGGIWGGVGGVIVANAIYQEDLEACNTTYKACIQKKKGN